MRLRAKQLLRGSIFGSTLQHIVPSNRYVSGGLSFYQSTSATKVAHSGSIVSVSDAVAALSNDGSTHGDVQSSNNNNEDNTPDNCMWPNALQYSLLQTVVEACQKKKHCKFSGSSQYNVIGASGVGDSTGTSSYHSSTVSSGVVGVDPCPKRKKIVEVAYKCRPYEFRSKVACHNDVAQLECNPYSRIAVYSASFGRTEYESIQCPQPQGVREETCLASYATETVMQICHGRRRCNLAADANTFGSPCQPNSRMYLKVVYTCVPKQVLKDRYESDVEADEVEDFEGDLNSLYDDELSYKESEAVPKLYSNTTAPATRSTLHAPISNANSSQFNNSLLMDENIGGVNPVMTHSADLSLEDDEERLYLYLLIVGSFSIIFCIIVIALRLLLQRPSSHNADSLSVSSLKIVGSGTGGGVDKEVPNGFNDTISEIDADIDLTTSIPLPSVSQNENYIMFGPSASLYGSVEPTNISSHSSSTLLLQGGVGITGGAIGRTSNAIVCGPTQSPDITDTSSGTFRTASNANSGNILAPAIVLSGGNALANSNVSSINSCLGSAFPITSLAQYTIAPTFRNGFIINTDGTLQRPHNTATPPVFKVGVASNIQNYTSSEHVHGPSEATSISSTSTLRRLRPGIESVSIPILTQEQLSSYDGTAPRTLPTGLPAMSQFYYG